MFKKCEKCGTKLRPIVYRVTRGYGYYCKCKCGWTNKQEVTFTKPKESKENINDEK